MIAFLGWVACTDAVGTGAAAFEAGDLPGAIRAWEAAPAPRSGVIEYDLGIAWYRSGDLARAIARFRAAARLRPRDGNVQHNLALARAGLAPGIPEPVGSPGWTAVLTPGELGLLAVLTTALGSLMVFPRRSRTLGGLALAGGLGAGGFATVAAFDLRAHPVVVVVDQEIVLRDAASVNAGERLRLPVGAEVRVAATHDVFLLVEDSRGRRGWVPTNGVEAAW
ncbi:MAG: hypothetical protein ABMA64_17450 [Myxococcota bacterium]